MAVQISINDLSIFRNTNVNKNIGVTYSCWDLLHAGHQLFLSDSKANCDILCVGLQTDPTIDRPEKNKPIQSLEEREIQLKSSRYVDYYFIYDTEQSLYDTLLALDPDLPIEIFYHPRSNHTYSTSNLRKVIYSRELAKLNMQ
jgi:glycerol-3-phosphate cytidylyltransferase